MGAGCNGYGNNLCGAESPVFKGQGDCVLWGEMMGQSVHASQRVQLHHAIVDRILGGVHVCVAHMYTKAVCQVMLYASCSPEQQGCVHAHNHRRMNTRQWLWCWWCVALLGGGPWVRPGPPAPPMHTYTPT